MFYFSTFYFMNYLFNFKHCHTQLYVIFLSYLDLWRYTNKLIIIMTLNLMKNGTIN